jgi:hypothetical protein
MFLVQTTRREDRTERMTKNVRMPSSAMDLISFA